MQLQLVGACPCLTNCYFYFLSADTSNQLIRKLDSSTMQISTVAGMPGFVGSQDGDALADATFNTPQSLAFDSAGRLFISDWGNCKIRMLSDGNISTIAGVGCSFADGDALTVAMFNRPVGIAWHSIGPALYICDNSNNRIRVLQLDPAVPPAPPSPPPALAPPPQLFVHMVSTYAGNGQPISVDGAQFQASMYGPHQLVAAPNGDLYWTDHLSHKIRVFYASNKTMATIAGNGQCGTVDGVGASAQFCNPKGIARAANGDLYVSDVTRHVIRRVQPDGTVTTVAGKPGQAGWLVSTKA